MSKEKQNPGLVMKGFVYLREYGFTATMYKVKRKIKIVIKSRLFLKKPLYTEGQLEAQRKEGFPRDIKISILVPLYNTPEKFLREMIQSVLDQTYANWELCLADGSDAKHTDVGRISMEYAAKDPRVCYQKLERNMGISGNTNACIDMSTGDYIALFDHDDLLHPAALHDVMKEICEKNADFVYTDEAVFESPNIRKIISIHFKPDYAIDNLRANNYICHLNVFRRELLEKAGGGFRTEYDGSQDHDLMLRLTSVAERIVHIPKVLYYWRSHPQSVASDISAKTYAITAGRKAVQDSILRSGYQAEVDSSEIFPTIYRIKYKLVDTPKVSILIVNRNNVENISRCVSSILEKSTYPNYEIIIVDNESDDHDTLAYYETLKKDSNIRIYTHKKASLGVLNNFAAEQAVGDYYLFLHSDTQVITNNWIEEILMYAQREDVGATGGLLYYPNDTIQHAGMLLGVGFDGVADHAFNGCRRETTGYMGRLWYSQNMSAVSSACMMVKAKVYNEISGFDESYTVAYNDVDLCLRMRKAGYLVVWTPYARLYHYEPVDLTVRFLKRKKYRRFEQDTKNFKHQWGNELKAGDPYYNINFEHDRGDFMVN